MTSKRLSVTLSAALLAVAGAAQADTARLVNPDNGHAYQRFDATLAWGSAVTACTGVGGYLATITSQTEQDWVWTNIMGGGASGIALAAWLGGSGLNADGEPEDWGNWVTGEDWDYENWDNLQPDTGPQHGLTIGTFPNGKWDNYQQGAALRYICEWAPDYLDTAVIFRASRRPAGPVITPFPSFAISDYALLARYGDSYYLQLLNGYTGKSVVSTLLGTSPTITPRNLTVTDHMSRALVTVLINQADGSSTAQVYDAASAVLLRTIPLPN